MLKIHKLDFEIATQVGSKFLNEKKVKIKAIGNGSNNLNFLIRSNKKEKWCIERSLKNKIPGPRVLALGENKGRAYMIQTFTAGINGKKIKNKSKLYLQLGRYAKTIHSIKIQGFGDKLTKDGKEFKDRWERFIDYNIKSLNKRDKLLKLKVFNEIQQNEVKQLFINFKKQKHAFGLNHGDLTSWNTLIERKGKINLLDWGLAEANIVPHFDLINFLRLRFEGSKPSEKEIKQFMKGYKMSKKEFNLLLPEVYKLCLLICIDKLRWVIDKNPNPRKLKKHSKMVKNMIRLNLI